MHMHTMTQIVKKSFCLAALLAAGAASAKTYYVAMNGNDENDGSSGAPFASVSVALAKDDVTEISIEEGEYSDMTPMVSSVTTANANTIDWIGSVEKAVAIVGAGPEKTILHCKKGSNKYCGGFILNNASASVSGVTVKNAGYSDTGNGNPKGTALRVISGVVSNCVMSDCGALSGWTGTRPLLSLESATAFAYDCTVKDSVRGIYCKTAAAYVLKGTMVRCLIANNSSGDGSSANGLTLDGGTAIDCVIRDNRGDNTTGHLCGGVELQGASKLLGCTVVGNTNNGQSVGTTTVSAGGVYVKGDGSVVSNCTITGNCDWNSCAVSAAGLAILGERVKVYDTVISNNVTTLGHELYMGESTCLVTNSVIANLDGRPLVNQKAGKLVDCVQDDGSEREDARPEICYVALDGSDTAPYDTEEKATPSLQKAIDAVRRGGTVRVASGHYGYENGDMIETSYLYWRQVWLLRPVRVIGPDDQSAWFGCTNKPAGSAKQHGAGFLVGHPDAFLSGVTISSAVRSGDTKNLVGSALQVNSGTVSNSTVTGCAFLSGSSHTNPFVGQGGGLMTHCAIRDNACGSAYWGRTALGLYKTGGTFTQGLIARNTIAGTKGDQCVANGAYVSAGTISDTIVEGNAGGSEKQPCASGVHLAGGTLERCIVQCNTNNAGSTGSAVKAVGGVYVSAKATVLNCLVAGNVTLTSSADSAGGIQVANANAEVHHVTVVGNSASAGVGGVKLDGYGSTLKASVVTDNVGASANNVQSTAGTPGFYETGVVYRDATQPFPLMWENVDAYSITKSSAGYNAVTENLVTDDLLGVVRPVVGEDPADNPDAGAMEKVDVQGVDATLSVSASAVPVGGQLTLTVDLDGSDPEIGSCAWTIVLPSGAERSAVSTDRTFVCSPDAAGSWTFKLVVTSKTGLVAPEKSVTIRAAPLVCYVSTTGSDEWPYDTTAKAARNFNDAIEAVHGSEAQTGTVSVATGVYENPKTVTAANGGAYALALTKPVKVVAADGDGTVVLRYNIGYKSGAAPLGGALYLADAGAEVRGFAVSGFGGNDAASRWSGFGNAVTMLGGAVRNCLFTNCQMNASWAVPLVNMSGGTVSGCLFSGTAVDNCWGRGPVGVYLTGGTVTNCVISGISISESSMDIATAGGVHMTGGTLCDSIVRDCKVGGPKTRNDQGCHVGGVRVDGGTVERCLICDNTNTVPNIVVKGDAGGLVVRGSAVVDHVTVAGNRLAADENCEVGGVNVVSGTLKNSIAWDNDGENLRSEGTVIATDSTVNPKFRRHGDYLIGCSSPCAYAGENRTHQGYAKPVPDGLMLLVR